MRALPETGRWPALDWPRALPVFIIVFVVQLGLVATTGTDVPFYDQWDVEGGWLYPGWRDGSVSWVNLVQPHNEHRILWTHLLNLGLFVGNGGQWDPLVQMVAIAGLHAVCAGVVVGIFARVMGRVGGAWFAGIIGCLSLPLAGWHNALWGFQSQFYFMELFALLAIGCLAGNGRSLRRIVFGAGAVVAAGFSMGAGGLVPLALLAGWGVRVGAARRCTRAEMFEGSGLMLLALGMVWLHPSGTGVNALQAAIPAQFLMALGRLLAWPHVAQPWAAFVMNLPFVVLVGLRLWGRRTVAVGEECMIVVGCWILLAAGAAAWSRGGGAEFAVGVPSRYADFMVLLPLVNLAAAVILLRDLALPHLRLGRLLVGCWTVFLFVGWAGLSTEAWRRIVLPRSRDVEAPVRLIQTFQRTGDTVVFAGQPRLLVPHPNLDSVRRVLHDPRMQGALPPSLQPDRPLGPLSRAVRWVLRR